MTMRIEQVFFRAALALIVGLCIGLERSHHGRAAGMRTHILVCLGSAITAMTGIWVFATYHTGDVFRLSAQVISGVGFLGAGMIILKNDNVISGLTTAAGVWATATLGLAIGYGFYVGALTATVLFLLALTLFTKFERKKRNTEVIYLELEDMKRVNEIIDSITKMMPKPPSFRLEAPRSGYNGHIGIMVIMDRRKGITLEEILSLEGVVFAVHC